MRRGCAGRTAHGLVHFKQSRSVALLCMAGHPEGSGPELLGDMWRLDVPIQPASPAAAPVAAGPPVGCIQTCLCLFRYPDGSGPELLGDIWRLDMCRSDLLVQQLLLWLLALPSGMAS